MKKIVALSVVLFIVAASVNARGIKSTGKTKMILVKKTRTNLKMIKREGKKVTGTLGNPQNASLVYASLPVSESYVPADVIVALTKKYGAQLYDITAVKQDNNQIGYVVRLMEGGGQFVFQKVIDI